LLFKAALSVAITTAEPGSTAGVLAMFFVVAYLGVGLPPVLLTAASDLIGSRSALIVFSAVILAISVMAAWLQAAALHRTSRTPDVMPAAQGGRRRSVAATNVDVVTGCAGQS
jgi:hypothetical protein